MKLYIGLDLGTSSLKLLLMDADRRARYYRKRSFLRYLVDSGKGKTLGFGGVSYFAKWKFLPPPPSREKVKEGTWAAGKSGRGGDCGFRGRTVFRTGQGEVRRVGLSGK